MDIYYLRNDAYTKGVELARIFVSELEKQGIRLVENNTSADGKTLAEGYAKKHINPSFHSTFHKGFTRELHYWIVEAQERLDHDMLELGL